MCFLGSLIADSNQREKKTNAIAPKKTLFKIIVQQDTNLFSESLLINTHVRENEQDYCDSSTHVCPPEYQGQ